MLAATVVVGAAWMAWTKSFARPVPTAVSQSPVERGTVLQLFDGWHGFVGSACVIAHVDNRTYMITTYHVVDGPGDAVKSNFGELRREAAAVESDLAIVSAPTIFGTPWQLGAPPTAGDSVICRGFFWAVDTETRGHVANDKLNWLDCAIGPGMSGGSVANAQGELVGLIRATWMPIDIGIMTSIHDIKDLIEETLP